MTPQEDFVRRYVEQGLETDDEVQIFLAWLQASGPDEWHRWAINWNWDYGQQLFEWIVSQPGCDKGTALSVYYAAQPDFFADYPSLVSSANDEAASLMKVICENWSRGTYTTYAFLPSEAALDHLRQGEEAMVALAAKTPWNVPDDMARAGIQGEPNNVERALDGIPYEMIEALRSCGLDETTV